MFEFIGVLMVCIQIWILPRSVHRYKSRSLLPAPLIDSQHPGCNGTRAAQGRQLHRIAVIFDELLTKKSIITMKIAL